MALFHIYSAINIIPYCFRHIIYKRSIFKREKFKKAVSRFCLMGGKAISRNGGVSIHQPKAAI